MGASPFLTLLLNEAVFREKRIGDEEEEEEEEESFQATQKSVPTIFFFFSLGRSVSFFSPPKRPSVLLTPAVVL